MKRKYIPATLSVAAISLFMALTILTAHGFAKKAKKIPTGTNAPFTLDFMTFYGFPDNSPPGTGIAHPVIHDGAGGKGTFADPITFAVAPQVQKSVRPGEIIYIPSLKKYFIMEDDCT